MLPTMVGHIWYIYTFIPLVFTSTSGREAWFLTTISIGPIPAGQMVTFCKAPQDLEVIVLVFNSRFSGYPNFSPKSSRTIMEFHSTKKICWSQKSARRVSSWLCQKNKTSYSPIFVIGSFLIIRNTESVPKSCLSNHQTSKKLANTHEFGHFHVWKQHWPLLHPAASPSEQLCTPHHPLPQYSIQFVWPYINVAFRAPTLLNLRNVSTPRCSCFSPSTMAYSVGLVSIFGK